MDGHLGTLQTTSSQPLVLLLADVYDLPTRTVSLCLAADSAHTAVGRSTMLELVSTELRNLDSIDGF